MPGRILIVDDEKHRVALHGLFTKEGYEVGTGRRAKRPGKIEGGRFHVIVTDLSMDGISGMQVLERGRAMDPDLAVVMITAHGSEKAAVQAMKLGATDDLPKPFDNDELRVVVRKAMEGAMLKRDHRRLLEQVQGAYGFEQLVGASPVMRRLFETIDRVADTDVTVLIRGERHRQGSWRTRSLARASPRESRSQDELRGAVAQLVERALQPRRVRSPAPSRAGRQVRGPRRHALPGRMRNMPLETGEAPACDQEKEFERVGGNAPVKVDVRLLAATNQDLGPPSPPAASARTSTTGCASSSS
jgi:DNA-binding NtrC family response regulator